MWYVCIHLKPHVYIYIYICIGNPKKKPNNKCAAEQTSWQTMQISKSLATIHVTDAYVHVWQDICIYSPAGTRRDVPPTVQPLGPHARPRKSCSRSVCISSLYSLVEPRSALGCAHGLQSGKPRSDYSPVWRHSPKHGCASTGPTLYGHMLREIVLGAHGCLRPIVGV